MFILIFILVLLILVVTHELGHFLMAKRFGIKVLEFGFGIPPKIWSKKIGGTVLSFNLLPFGGFVRLLGEDEVDEKTLNNPRSFAAKAVKVKIVVVAAGVVMNLFLAWLLFYTVLISQNFKIIYPLNEPVVVIADVQKGMPAHISGIKVGERLAEIDGEKTDNVETAAAAIKSKPDKTVKLILTDIDGNNPRSVTVTPKILEPKVGLIGVAFSSIPFKSYQTYPQKIFSGITYSWDLTKLTFFGLGKLFSDLGSGNFAKASQNVSGPIGLVSISKNIYSLGTLAVVPYIWFVGVISLTLAIFNSLPVPALDGGRLVFLFLELILGKKVSPKIEKQIHNIGMALLLALIALITFSDIKKLF